MDIFQNGLPIIVLWVVGGLLALYVLVAFVTQLSVGRLFWQNVWRSNRVELPKMGKSGKIPASGATDEERETLILARTPDAPGPAERGGLIYPAQGRNGLNFKPDSCSSCGLCLFVCPSGAISTTPTEKGYARKFDLGKCVYCGLCESACPTQAIRLTVEQPSEQNQPQNLVISGEISWEKCPKCKALPPRADLFAGRIYNFEDEADDYKREKRILAVQTEAACPECARLVLAAEEAVCE